MTGVAPVPFLSFADVVSVSESDRQTWCRSDAGISPYRLIPANSRAVGGGAGAPSLDNAPVSVICARRPGEARP
jgi:hypothetical protein